MPINENTSFFHFFFSPSGKMEKDEYITGNMIIFCILILIILLRDYISALNATTIIISAILHTYVSIVMGIKRIRDANLPMWLTSFFFLSATLPVIVVFLCLYDRRKSIK